MNDQVRSYAVVVGILVLITGGLLYIDMQNEAGDSSSPGFFSSVVRDWVRSGTLNADVLAQTSLADARINRQSSTPEFLAPYLSLPENIFASVATIADTSITVYEVQTRTPQTLMSHLLDQPSNQYRFNTINQGTFYLNQVPAETKTHNYLAIAIEDVVYGFVYKPIDHRKVLEIIDVLQKNQ